MFYLEEAFKYGEVDSIAVDINGNITEVLLHTTKLVVGDIVHLSACRYEVKYTHNRACGMRYTTVNRYIVEKL